MKLLKYSISIIVLFAVTIACENSRKDNYSAKHAELMHIYNDYVAHKPLPPLAKIDSLQLYFEKYGTDEDRLLSHYCKGASYYQDHCKRAAYMEMRKGYEEAPSHLSPLAREIMRGVLYHLQRLCIIDFNYTEAEQWWRKADSLKVYSDEKMYSHYCNKAMLLFYDHREDSGSFYLKKSLDNIRQYPSWDENKSACLSDISAYYAVTGKTAEFKEVYKLLQLHPYHGESTTKDVDLGLFYAQQGMRDSADYHFREALKLPPIYALSAALQLGISARNRQMHDSVFFYFQKCVSLYDSIVAEQGNSFTRDVEAICDNHEKERKIAEQRMKILRTELWLVVALLIAFLGFGIAFVYREHLRKTRKDLEFEQKRREEVEARLQETIDEMSRRQKALEEEDTQKSLKAMLHELACMADAKKSASTEHLAQLVGVFTAQYPHVYEKMKSEYARIKSTDYVICILVKSDFKQSQIAKLLDRENAEIYHFIKRISKGLTGEPIGRMEDFKAMLDERFFGEDNE